MFSHKTYNITIIDFGIFDFFKPNYCIVLVYPRKQQFHFFEIFLRQPCLMNMTTQHGTIYFDVTISTQL